MFLKIEINLCSLNNNLCSAANVSSQEEGYTANDPGCGISLIRSLDGAEKLFPVESVVDRCSDGTICRIRVGLVLTNPRQIAGW
jgi:hypothetical protein